MDILFKCGYLPLGMDIHNAIQSRKIFIGKYLHNTIDMCGYIHRYLYVYLNIVDIYEDIYIWISV